MNRTWVALNKEKTATKLIQHKLRRNIQTAVPISHRIVAGSFDVKNANIMALFDTYVFNSVRPTCLSAVRWVTVMYTNYLETANPARLNHLGGTWTNSFRGRAPGRIPDDASTHLIYSNWWAFTTKISYVHIICQISWKEVRRRQIFSWQKF